MYRVHFMCRVDLNPVQELCLPMDEYILIKRYQL